LKEGEKKQNEDNEKLLSKRVYTYDFNGEIVFVKIPRTEKLP
jgi:hypothetical protein